MASNIYRPQQPLNISLPQFQQLSNPNYQGIVDSFFNTQHKIGMSPLLQEGQQLQNQNVALQNEREGLKNDLANILFPGQVDIAKVEQDIDIARANKKKADLDTLLQIDDSTRNNQLYSVGASNLGLLNEAINTSQQLVGDRGVPLTSYIVNGNNPFNTPENTEVLNKAILLKQEQDKLKKQFNPSSYSPTYISTVTPQGVVMGKQIEEQDIRPLQSLNNNNSSVPQTSNKYGHSFIPNNGFKDRVNITNTISSNELPQIKKNIETSKNKMLGYSLSNNIPIEVASVLLGSSNIGDKELQHMYEVMNKMNNHFVLETRGNDSLNKDGTSKLNIGITGTNYKALFKGINGKAPLYSPEVVNSRVEGLMSLRDSTGKALFTKEQAIATTESYLATDYFLKTNRQSAIKIANELGISGDKLGFLEFLVFGNGEQAVRDYLSSDSSVSMDSFKWARQADNQKENGSRYRNKDGSYMSLDDFITSEYVRYLSGQEAIHNLSGSNKSFTPKQDSMLKFDNPEYNKDNVTEDTNTLASQINKETNEGVKNKIIYENVDINNIKTPEDIVSSALDFGYSNSVMKVGTKDKVVSNITDDNKKIINETLVGLFYKDGKADLDTIKKFATLDINEEFLSKTFQGIEINNPRVLKEVIQNAYALATILSKNSSYHNIKNIGKVGNNFSQLGIQFMKEFSNARSKDLPKEKLDLLNNLSTNLQTKTTSINSFKSIDNDLLFKDISKGVERNTLLPYGKENVKDAQIELQKFIRSDYIKDEVSKLLSTNPNITNEEITKHLVDDGLLKTSSYDWMTGEEQLFNFKDTTAMKTLSKVYEDKELNTLTKNMLNSLDVDYRGLFKNKKSSVISTPHPDSLFTRAKDWWNNDQLKVSEFTTPLNHIVNRAGEEVRDIEFDGDKNEFVLTFSTNYKNKSYKERVPLKEMLQKLNTSDIEKLKQGKLGANSSLTEKVLKQLSINLIDTISTKDKK